MRSLAGRAALAMSCAALAFLSVAPPALADVYVEHRLTTNPFDQTAPTINADRAAYEDNRFGDSDIRAYSFNTDVHTRITDQSADQEQPCISGDRLVWQDKRHGNYDIYQYRYSSASRSRLTESPLDQTVPDLAGTRLAWDAFDNTQHSVYTMNLANDAPSKRISAWNNNWLSPPEVSGYRITWVEDGGTPHDPTPLLRLYTAGGDAADVTPPGGYYPQEPSISGARLAWSDYTDPLAPEWDVVAYDIPSSNPSRVSQGDTQTRPRVSGTLVVYEYAPAGVADLWLYDTRQDLRVQLTNDLAIQRSADISGSRVIWQDDRNGNWDIYTMDLPLTNLHTTAPSAVGYGTNARLNGTLTNSEDVPLLGESVRIQRSADGEHWSDALVTTTDSDGRFTYLSPAITERTYLRAVFNGNGSALLSSEGASHEVGTRAYLSRPTIEPTVDVSGWYSAIGSLRPQHTAGSRPVTLYCYRREGGSYVLRRTYTARAFNDGPYTTYNGSIRLPLTGSWAIRAKHEDAGHLATYSAWTYVTAD